MSLIAEIKDELIEELWLPAALRAGKIIRPRYKNRDLRVFSLTNHMNYREIPILVENNVTRCKRELVVVWHRRGLVRYRLDPEPGVAGADIMGQGHFERSCCGSQTHPLDGKAPFHIVNLDFTSQEQDYEQDRLENEVESLERTVRLQRECRVECFLLIYTTLVLRETNLDLSELATRSNRLSVAGWAGLYSPEISLQEANGTPTQLCGSISRICEKYAYGCDPQIAKKALSNREGWVFSVACLLEGGEG